jgi:hypothetical protein
VCAHPLERLLPACQAHWIQLVGSEQNTLLQSLLYKKIDYAGTHRHAFPSSSNSR